jgi:integrase/recombinase XerD
MNIKKIQQNYLTMRRGLGFKLRSEGTLLTSFVSYLETHNTNIITTKLALAWAKLPKEVQPARWARRLSIVRGFARYCSAIDSTSEVPPIDILSISYQRRTPYIFTEQDIKKLLLAPAQSSVKNCFFAQTLSCLFGLLSVTGLRIREALNLTMDDVDLQTGILTVRNTKFNKSRLLPLHSTTINVLVNYQEQRKKFLGKELSSNWFVGRHRKPLGYYCVKYHFDNLLASLELSGQPQSRKPHLHDFRHYFALSVLINWYRNGEDVQRQLPILSTYLGHVETSDTFWYLTACPGLMSEAKKRLELHWEKQS